jgi:hypothetical protein
VHYCIGEANTCYNLQITIHGMYNAKCSEAHANINALNNFTSYDHHNRLFAWVIWLPSFQRLRVLTDFVIYNNYKNYIINNKSDIKF